MRSVQRVERRCGCPTRRVYVWDSCGDEFGCGCWVPRTSGLRAVCVPNDAAGRVGLLILPFPVLHYPAGSIGMGAPHVGFTCGAFALVVPRSSLSNRIDWHGCPTRRVYVWGFCSCCSPFFITQPDRLGLTRPLPSHRTTNCSMANPWDAPQAF